MEMNKKKTGGIKQTEGYPCLVSIICPVYNVENEIGRCIESVINQKFDDFELILIDDGSTDKSYEICMKYKADDSRLRLVRIENGGAANARNVGLGLCKGEFIAFIDSDDAVEPDWLRVLVDLIGDAELSVVGFYTDVPGKTTWSPINDANKRKIDAKQCFHEIFDGDVTTYLWNKLYRRKIIEEHGLIFDLDTYWGEDAQFIAKYCNYVRNAVIYTGKLYHYIQRKGSIVNSGFDKRMLGFLHGYQEIEAISERFQECDIVSLTICLHCQSLLYRWFWSKDKDSEVCMELKNELISRRPVLKSGSERHAQRAVCLMMSYSITLTCMVLNLYKRVKVFWNR